MTLDDAPAPPAAATPPPPPPADVCFSWPVSEGRKGDNATPGKKDTIEDRHIGS